MEKYLEITKVHLKHNTWQHLAVSVLLLLASPLILGISNLDEAQSAKVLETYVALTGIILFVPVFLPEQNREIRAVVRSKYTDILAVYAIRLAAALFFLAVLVFIYMAVMRAGNCEMEMGRYYLGTMAEAVGFGGLGIFAYALSDNVVAGYMIPLGYYVAALGGGAKYLGKFYPFGMLTDYCTKYWILLGGIVLIAGGIWICRNHSAV